MFYYAKLDRVLQAIEGTPSGYVIEMIYYHF